MLQPQFAVRAASPFIGGLLSVISLAAVIGCSAPERDIIHAIPIRVSSSGAPKQEVPQFALDPATTLIVAVVDLGGTPVPGADVTVLHAAALDPAALVLSTRITGDRTRTLAMRATWRGQTTDDGLVSIPLVGDEGCLVAAEAGGLYGECEYHGSGGAELRLTLTARRTVEVFVANSDGSPAEGVPLTIRAKDAKGVLQTLPITAVTDAGGRAALHVPVGAPEGLQVIARLAMGSPPSVSIAGEAVEEIHLPEMGAVAINVQGHPTFEGAAAGVVQIFAASDGSRSRATLAVPIVNGRALIPRVEAGVPLRVICAVADGTRPSEILASQSVPVAPVAAGETGEVEVSFGQYQRVGRKLEPR